MKFLRLFILFLTGMGITGFLLSINTPRWLIFAAVIIFYLVLMVFPGIYITYFSNSLRQIDRYILRNRHKAIFAYPYALGYGSDQDIERALKQILQVHKQPEMQAIYQTLLALHRGQVDLASQHAGRIERQPMRSYYLAQIAALAGDTEQAYAINKGISEAWMYHSIDAHIAFESDRDKFQTESRKSVESARGIQKYMLDKSFKRIQKQLPD